MPKGKKKPKVPYAGKPRGFATLSPERMREIASQGGKAAQASGKARRWTSEEARVAGRKGGISAHNRGVAHTFTSEEAREAGRKGSRPRRVPGEGPPPEAAE